MEKKKGKPLNQSQMDVKEGKTIFHKRKVRELVTDEPEIKEMLMGVLQAEGNDTEWKLRFAGKLEKHWVSGY